MSIRTAFQACERLWSGRCDVHHDARQRRHQAGGAHLGGMGILVAGQPNGRAVGVAGERGSNIGGSQKQKRKRPRAHAFRRLRRLPSRVACLRGCSCSGAVPVCRIGGGATSTEPAGLDSFHGLRARCRAQVAQLHADGLGRGHDEDDAEKSGKDGEVDDAQGIGENRPGISRKTLQSV